jgi:ATP-dependent Clp protease ATP-binding subunit ClpA
MSTHLDGSNDIGAPIRLMTNDAVGKASSGFPFPQIHIEGDELFLSCWTEACAFAKGFRADCIEVDHLLLGATYTKAGAEVLKIASDDVVGLRHELAARCARSASQEGLDIGEAYAPSDSLRRLLYEAAALATGEGDRKIGLHHLLTALKNSRPPVPVISALSRFRAEIETRQKEMVALSQLPDLVRAAITDRLLPALESRVEERLDEFETRLQRPAAEALPGRGSPSIFARVRSRQ